MPKGNHLGGASLRLERGLFRWFPELLDLTEASRARLIDSARLLSLPAGAELPDEAAVGCVLDGRLGILKPLPEGRGHIVGLPGPGSVLGWMTGEEGAGYRIAALEPSEVALLDPALFQGRLQDLPDLEQRLMGQVMDEAEAARWVKANMKKPVVGFIAGVTAPPGKRMGHAGALISGGADTADAKLAIMEECGFTVTRNPSEMGKLLKALL